jgi:copper chaperone CopZ
MKSILIIGLLVISNSVFSQSKDLKEVQIQTSAQCLECKVRIEEKLLYSKGIKYATLDDRTKIVTVGYSSKKLTEAQIKQFIAETGYDADEVKATKEGFDKLPMCCRPVGMEKH